jgi:hypothetical protein
MATLASKNPYDLLGTLTRMFCEWVESFWWIGLFGVMFPWIAACDELPSFALEWHIRTQTPADLQNHNS